MEIKQLQQWWKYNRAIPAYQHTALVLGFSKEDIDKMFYWECVLDDIAAKEEKLWKHEYYQARKSFYEWKDEDADFAREARIRYLEPIVNDLKKYVILHGQRIEAYKKKRMPHSKQRILLLFWDIETTEKKLKKLGDELERELHFKEIK